MPKYKIAIHRRIQKFMKELRNGNAKNALMRVLAKFENYPAALRGMDVEKIKGLERIVTSAMSCSFLFYLLAAV